LKPIRILYVDDSALDRELVRATLEEGSADVELVTAATRAEFETCLAQGEYDLVLSDFNILGFEGLQVFDAVRARCSCTPVVIVTGTGSEEVAVEALRRGVADYVIKTPGHIRRLSQTIKSVLEKQRAESQREAALEALRESEERFRTLFEQAAVGVALLETKTGRYIQINQKYCDSLGYTIEEMLHKTFRDITYPADTQTNADNNALLIAGTINEFSIEKRYIRKDGTVVWGNLTASPLWKSGTEPGTYFHIAVVEDITVRKRAEEALKAYSEQLEAMVEERTRKLQEAQEQLVQREKLAVVGQLAGGVGHELRTPLGNIKNAAYFLNMVIENPDAEVREMLGILEKEVLVSERIINSLLDFARSKPPARRKVNVNQLIQETLADLVVPAGVTLRSRLEGQPVILADPDQFCMILSNLVTNAVQAMPEGGQLDIETRAGEKELAISVADTGVGIPPENMDKLFEPLFTTKPKGIGLGLALVKMLIEGYGGRVLVESEPGQGSKFSVWLPLSVELEV